VPERGLRGLRHKGRGKHKARKEVRHEWRSAYQMQDVQEDLFRKQGHALLQAEAPYNKLYEVRTSLVRGAA
jgi:hypothetical protein